MSETFRPVGRATPAVEATVGAVAAAATGAGSALRRKRVFHPVGVAFDATVQVTGAAHGSRLLDEPASHPAVVRLSRGVGLPTLVPDFLGLAIRLVDVHGPGRHQDLLLVSSGDRPGLRHLLVPARSFEHERYSTLVPYRVGGRRVVFGARRLGGGAPLHVEDLASGLGPGEIRFALELAAPRGAWEPIGVLTLDEHLGADAGAALRFDPAHSAGGIEPVGVVQAVRRLSYRASQAARPTT